MAGKVFYIEELPSGEFINKDGVKFGSFPEKIKDQKYICTYIYRETTGAIFCLKHKYDNKNKDPEKRRKTFFTAYKQPGDNMPWIGGLPRETAYPPFKADILSENKRSSVLVVEGEKDVSCQLSQSIERELDMIVTAVTLGETKTDYSLFDHRKEVFYYPDGDLAGYKRAWAFLEMVPGAKILRPVFSETRKEFIDLAEMDEDGYNPFNFLEIIEGTEPIDPIELMELAGIEKDTKQEIKKDPEFTQIANHKTAGDYLEKIWRGYVIWVDNEAQFYRFEGSRWEGFYNIKNEAYNVFFDLVIEFTRVNGEKGADLLKTISRQTKSFIRDTLEFFKGHPSVFRKDVLWDSRKIDMTLTLSDGVIDFSNGKLQKRKGDKLEYRRNYLPLLCDDVIKAKRPDYFLDTMIHGVMPNKDNQETLLSWMAMIPTRFTEIKKGAFFIGEGNTGKTTLIEIIVELFPRLIKKLPSDVLLPAIRGFGNGNTATPEQAKMEGKLLCYTSETEKGKKLSNNLFKELTGGEEITARELYQKPKTFKPTFQILISTNHPPHFDATDRATFNRILPIIFEQVHDVGSPGTISGDEIKKKCLAEWPAILKFLCEKAISIRKNDDIIPLSPQFAEFKERYREQQKGDIDMFIDNVLMLDENSFIPYHQLVDVFADYHDITEAKQKEKIDVRVISSVIRSRWGHVQKRRRIAVYNGYNKQFNGLQGIKIKPVEEWESEPDYDDKIPF